LPESIKVQSKINEFSLITFEVLLCFNWAKMKSSFVPTHSEQSYFGDQVTPRTSDTFLLIREIGVKYIFYVSC